MECGFTRSYSAHHRLINQNEAIEAIYVIMEGQSHVFANGFHVATLEKGEFIGEMSFLTNTPPRADVIVSQDSQIHFWSTEDLRSHFGKRPLMLGKFHSAIGNQVISKLVVKSLAEAK
jgi:CRP-like cAMP-binding protein